jgi:hypothetical protein
VACNRIRNPLRNIAGEKLTMKYLPTAAIVLAVALATPVDAASYEDTWVLLGLDIHMGAVTTRTFPEICLHLPMGRVSLLFLLRRLVSVRSLEPWPIMLGRAMRRGLSVAICAQTGGLGRQSGIDCGDTASHDF